MKYHKTWEEELKESEHVLIKIEHLDKSRL